MDLLETISLILVKNNSTISNTNVITTKDNKEEHGLGIRNVVATLEKYNAEYIIDYKDGEFLFSIIIWLRELQSNGVIRMQNIVE